MTALYRDGRQADALAAYRQARGKLVAEGGRAAAFTSRDPAEDTVRLAAEHDAALLLVSWRPTGA